MKSNYKNTTQTPNSLFDNHLSRLGCAELKVLLVIIRQTVGFLHPQDKFRRKDRDWISQRYFMQRAGLSGRAISSAIASLVSKGLILVTTKKGRIMHTIEERRGTSRLYYASTLVLVNNLHNTYDVLDDKAVKNLHTTKLKHTKLLCNKSSQGFQRITDRQRIEQLLKIKKNE